MKFFKTKILALLLVALFSFNAHSTPINLDGSDTATGGCGTIAVPVLGATCWTDDMTSEPSLSDLETLLGLAAGSLTNTLYKQDTPGSESGDFAAYYSNLVTGNGSESVAMTWDGILDPLVTMFIDSCADPSSCYLFTKDGGVADPNIVVWDISGWDGMMAINIVNLYEGQGTLSNFAIVGGPGCQIDCNGNGGGGQEIPEPGMLFLFASGLFGLAWSRRKITH